jgi:hypothetical protein
MAIRHVYSQTVADGTATSVVRPSDWNSAHNQTLFIAGNTAGASSISGSDIYWAGGSNVTLSANGSTVSVIGVAAQTNQTQASGAIAGTGFTSTTTAGTAVTAALGTNGLTMAVPAFLTTTPAQTVDTGKAGTGFTSTTTAGSVITAALGTNGLTMAVPAFLTTTPAQTVDTGKAGTGFTSTTTAGTAITAALGTNGLTMAVPNFITTYVNDLTSGRAGTGFTSTTTAGTAITAALGTNGLTMAVPNFITTYAAQTVDTNKAGTGTTLATTNISATLNANTNGVALSLNVPNDDFNGWNLVGNTSGTNATTITTQGPLYLSGGNNITLSGNSNTIVISAGAAGTINQTGPNIGVSNLGNTLGSTGTVSTGNVVFVGGSGVTLSQSTAAAGSNATITIIGNTPPIMSRGTFPNYAEMTFLSAPVNASASVNAVTLPIISGTRMDILLYQSIQSSATGNTYGQQWSIYMGIYSNDTAGSRLVSLSSGSTQTTYTVASNTAGVTQLNGSGIRPISCPVNFSVTPGEYYIAVNHVTNTFSSGTATTSLNRTVSIVGNAMQSASWAIVPDYTVASAATNNSLQPAGVFSAASTGLPGTISYSQLTMTGASRSQANFIVVMRNN